MDERTGDRIDGSVPGQTPLIGVERRGLLRPEAIITRRQLNLAQAANILKAQYKYLAGPVSARAAPFDESWMRRLHREMLGDVWDWAGRYRTTEKNIGVASYEIATAVLAVCDEVPVRRDSGMSWRERGVLLHHGAVFIHPFANGNGRWSRMATNIWLRRRKQPVVLWPEQTMGESSVARCDYFSAIRAADQFDYGPLTRLHARYTEPARK